MGEQTPAALFRDIMRNDLPDAQAWIRGNAQNPQLSGLVKFYATPYGGVIVEAEIFGLPNITQQHSTDFYGFHIHQYGNCTPPFDNAGEHYSNTQAMHPDHTGDLVPLLGNQGYAWLAFYDKRFTVPEIIDKSVIIHDMPDDFRTQPAGNSGNRIGCGVIRRVRK